jgi:hypothetical protein
VNKATKEPQREPHPGRDGWSVLEKSLGLTTAVLALVTAVIGYIGVRAVSERDDVQEESQSLSDDVDALEKERDQLDAALSDAQERIDELEHPTTTNAQVEPAQDPTFLVDLEPVDSVPYWGPSRDLDIDGTIYVHGLATRQIGSCGSSGGLSEADVEYSIGQRYTTFHAMAGVSESSSAGLPVKLEVFADSTSIRTLTLAVGQPQSLDLDVTNVLRLRFVATQQFEDDADACARVFAAMGDPTLR